MREDTVGYYKVEIRTFSCNTRSRKQSVKATKKFKPDKSAEDTYMYDFPHETWLAAENTKGSKRLGQFP